MKSLIKATQVLSVPESVKLPGTTAQYLFQFLQYNEQPPPPPPQQRCEDMNHRKNLLVFFYFLIVRCKSIHCPI